MFKKYIAEFFGTFTLTLVVILSLGGIFPIPTPVLAAVTLLLFVYSIGHISGAHINPAVTIGLLTLKKIKPEDAISYILTQLSGSVTALLAGLLLNVQYQISTSNAMLVGIAEFVGTMFFSFGIASVVYGNVHKAMSGVVIGASLFMGIALSVLIGSNGILNPAVAIGIKSFGLAYIIGPILGSIVGMNLYRFLNSETKN